MKKIESGQNTLFSVILGLVPRIHAKHLANVILGLIPRIHAEHSSVDTRDTPEYDRDLMVDTRVTPEYDGNLMVDPQGKPEYDHNDLHPQCAPDTTGFLSDVYKRSTRT